ncbi:uncharacterized protein LOC101899883 [Musca domestica]|uniref:Uncharacterized protein LOC101899883 n=1 Tax=Musca domestica TaxID=7370 RepID=A0A9J7D127_MUSDO|nr:uncharacterized protein LOC101899883 [Musca domestica]
MEASGHVLDIYPANVTRPAIINFSFPYKLWLVINLDFWEFLRWNRDGTVILLDLSGLEEYLNSMRSIFKIKNCSVFLKHLDEFKFERLNVQLEAEEDILLQYKHESFQRYRLDLLANVRRDGYADNGCIENGDDKEGSCSNRAEKNPQLMLSRKVSSRMPGDLCFMSHGCLSQIQRSRIRFQTIFNFQNEAALLRDKLRVSDEIAERNRRSCLTKTPTRITKAANDNDQVIEVSADLYENPHDSVLHFADDFRPEYAGYYGNVSKEMLLNFFGEYLPTYADGTMEVQKIIADSSANKAAITTDINTETVIPSDMTTATYTNYGSTTSTLISSEDFQAIDDLHFTSSLQPIFKTEDEQKNVYESPTEFHIFSENVAVDDVDTEISMDEFLKFKDPLALHCNDNMEMKNGNDNIANNGTHCDDFLKFKDPLEFEENKENFNDQPQCSKNSANRCQPPKLKMNEDNNKEDEQNFRSFFRQYKASLNLLYDN